MPPAAIMPPPGAKTASSAPDRPKIHTPGAKTASYAPENLKICLLVTTSRDRVKTRNYD